MNPVRCALVLLSAVAAAAAAILALEILVPVTLTLDLECGQTGEVQVFWRSGGAFGDETVVTHPIPTAGRYRLRTSMPAGIEALRIDLPSDPGWTWISRLEASHLVPLVRWEEEAYAEWQPWKHVSHFAVNGTTLELRTDGEDPHIVNWRAGRAMRRGLRRERIPVASIAAALAAAAAWLATRGRRAPVLSRLAGRTWAAKLGLSAASFVVFGAIGYLFLDRWRGAETGSYYQGEGGSYALSFLDLRGNRISPECGPLGLMFDPLLFFRNYPGQRTNQFSIDENGFRGGIADPAKPRVFVLGGSAAFGYGLPGDDLLFTARLERKVPAYTFVNAATVGYLSGQELALMVHYLHRFRPHTYILFDGWNDLVETGEQEWRTGANGQHVLFTGRLREFLQMTEKEALPPWPFPREPPATTSEERTAEVLDRYCANVEKMHTWARANGSRFVVVFQPELGNKRVKTGEEWTRGFNTEMSARYREFVEHAARFCAARGILRLNVMEEPAHADSERTLFYDAVHLNPAGHQVVADIVAALLARLDR